MIFADGLQYALWFVRLLFVVIFLTDTGVCLNPCINDIALPWGRAMDTFYAFAALSVIASAPIRF